MDLQNSPQLLFFKQDENDIKQEVFKEKTWAFLKKNFQVATEEIAYGSVSYSPPERDNQFHETYTRSVYHVFRLSDGKEFVLYFCDEAADNTEFKESFTWSFYQCTIYCLQLTDWASVKQLWLLFKPFMLELGFRDATLDFTYIDGGLLAFYEKKQNHAAVQEIAKLTEVEIVEKLKSNPSSSIEIQSKTYLDIDSILLQVPNKEEITGIRIPNNALTHFPSSLIQFKNLEELFIYNNNIQTVPDNLQELKHLRYLHIRGNGIATDAAAVQKLKELLPKDCELVCE